LRQFHNFQILVEKLWGAVACGRAILRVVLKALGRSIPTRPSSPHPTMHFCSKASSTAPRSIVPRRSPRNGACCPHAVMIANGWLSASDYYRALAQACGVPFRGEIGPHEVTAPASLKSPRECLARGLLKEQARQGAYVFAPERLRPNAVEEALGRLAPHRLSLASPDTLRQAVYGHFAQNLAAASVDGLHARFPDRSAKAKLATWQRLSLFSLLLAFAAALVLHAQPAIRALSLALVVLFLPVVALRMFAAYDLLRRAPAERIRGGLLESHF
jgi:hypothetical protein